MAKIIPVPGEPGTSADARIVPDIAWIRRHFKVDFRDVYASSGHASGGEHPLGLGADIIPDTRRGGTWDDVDRLGKFAAQHRDVFGFVGYDGRFGTDAYPNHGRGNHLHLSWRHGIGGARGQDLRFLTHGKGAIVRGGNTPSWLERSLQQSLGAIPGAGPALQAAESVSGVVGDAIGFGADKAGDLAGDVAGKVVGTIIDAIGKDALKIALYPALLIGGVALLAVGLARMLGVSPADAIAVAPAGRALKAAGAGGAATKTIGAAI